MGPSKPPADPTPTTSAETTTKSDFVSSKSAPSAERVAALEAETALLRARLERLHRAFTQAMVWLDDLGLTAPEMDQLHVMADGPFGVAALATLDEHA